MHRLHSFYAKLFEIDIFGHIKGFHPVSCAQRIANWYLRFMDNNRNAPAAPAHPSNPDQNIDQTMITEQLITGNGQLLRDHDLLQYFLAIVSPHSDTRLLASRLIGKFGGLAELLSADGEAIQANSGMSRANTALLKAIHTACLHLIAQPVRCQPMLTSWPALLDYLRADMAYLAHERVRILHLNSKNYLIKDEIVSEGSVDHAALYPRKIIKRALDLGSAALILVHNHPHGESAPSREDIAITKKIGAAARSLGITLHDHLIIGNDGCFSLRSKGLL
ncbi:MAG: DNA repair protein RadC [Parasphingorhabdus sp.]|uniref:JAB domain-containing protein n=1 Tax=Parasphingorhabdus sp. TaxID=2709688 RepID=UPI00329A2DB6